MTLSQQLLGFTMEALQSLLERGLRRGNGGFLIQMDVHAPLPQGSVVRASIIHQRKARQPKGPHHAEEEWCSINLHYLLPSLASRFSPILNCTFLFFRSPLFQFSFTVAVILFSLKVNSLRNACRGYLGEKKRGWALGLGKLEYSLSGQSYVRLGMTGSHSSYSFSTARRLRPAWH